MGTLYVDSGGSLTNSGSTDQNAANLSGTAAVAASTTVTLDGSPDLSGLSTSGANQSTIYLSTATNSNLKIFWITAFDNSAKTVTVSIAPTGVAASAWAIGGRCLTPNQPLNAARAGDTVQVNNDITVTGSIMATFRNAGSSAGYVKLIGKSGARRKLTSTDTNAVVNFNSLAGTWLENVELAQQGASGNAAANFVGGVVKNSKISDAGASGLSIGAVNGGRIIDSEITGTGGDGIACNSAGVSLLIHGCNIHGCGQDGLSDASTIMALTILDSIIASNTRDGINITAAPSAQTHLKAIIGNTIVANGRDGVRGTDSDIAFMLRDNIIKDNVANNVNMSAGSVEATGNHSYNVFSQTLGGSSVNLVGLTTDATDLTSDPLFTSQAGGDYSLQSGSPAKAAGYPGQILGGSLGYRDIGAVQRQEPAASVRRHTTSILSRPRGIGLT